MGWFFLVGGVAIDLLLAVGLVYAITHSEWQWAVEAAIGLAILGGTPWLGWRFLQEYRSG